MRIADPFSLPVRWLAPGYCAVSFGYLQPEPQDVRERVLVGVEPFAPGIWMLYAPDEQTLKILSVKPTWVVGYTEAVAKSSLEGWAWPENEDFDEHGALVAIIPQEPPGIAGGRTPENFDPSKVKLSAVEL